MQSRRTILLAIVLSVAVIAWLVWHNFSSRQQQTEQPAVAIDQQPPVSASHTFDPNAPPADMPALAYGEEAACDSNFLSNTSVAGVSEKKDATHANVTITKVTITLQLNVNIWVPTNVNPHIVEHENGHRQISEWYYRTANQLAGNIANTYLGRQIDIVGADLNAAMEKVLQQTATKVTKDYDEALNVAATQQYYDTITNHGRNDLDAKRAVSAALENTKLASIP